MITLFYTVINFFSSYKYFTFWITLNGLLAFYIRQQITPYYKEKYVKKYKKKQSIILNSEDKIREETTITDENKESKPNNEINIEKENKTEEYEIVNIHDEYPEFKRHDKLPSFFFMWFSASTFMWIKGSLWFLFLSIIWLDCK